RNKIIFVTMVAIVAIVIMSFNSERENLDLTNMKDKMQAWVDSGKQKEEVEKVEEIQPIEETKNPKTSEKNYIDINISEGIVAKAEYIEEQGKKKFVSVEPIDGVSFNISPLKEQILFVDKAQNLKIANTEGVIRDLTKKAYISQAGKSFQKDEILKTTPTYIWHSQGKFIDDTKIVYVSELPYFGNGGQKQFVWLYDLATGSENALWSLVGNKIVVGDVVPDKGITITVNGIVFYLKADGSVSQ
ncbi:MAG TPA: hypothetical protein VIK26_01845, partial [Clostridium sp.]